MAIVALVRALFGRIDAITAELGVSTLDEEIAASMDAPPDPAHKA